MATKTKTVYVCSECGAESPKWIGRCPQCGEWNTYQEEHISVGGQNAGESAGLMTEARAVPLNSVEQKDVTRMTTGNGE